MPWGTVRAYQPGKEIVFSWHVSCPEHQATEIAVGFFAVADGRTRVDLLHRHWDNMGEAGAEARENYASGWDEVFVTRFGAAFSG